MSSLLVRLYSTSSAASERNPPCPRPISGGNEIQPGNEYRTAVGTPASSTRQSSFSWASLRTYAHRRRASGLSSRVGTFRFVWPDRRNEPAASLRNRQLGHGSGAAGRVLRAAVRVSHHQPGRDLCLLAAG